MLKAGLIGIGGMGRGHLDNYIRFTKENEIIQLVAVCDVNPEKFGNAKVDFNLDGVGAGDYDFSGFHCYTDMDEMIEKEELDLVSIALPTYLHCEATVKCLKKGINVFCEKPMALNVEQCQLMIDTAKETGKHLMIGQCLRFWGEYTVLKEYVDNGKLGKPVSAYFFRGGSTPMWSFENWLQKRECGGGALHDQHVHDVDMISYLFGMPKAVSTVGKIVMAGSGYDTVSTNYIYEDGFACNAQDDWMINGEFGFEMSFRVNFEGGAIIMDSKGLRVLPNGEKAIRPDYDHESAYYNEIKYYANCIINGTENTINPPEASLNTIKIVEAETESADKNGVAVAVKA